jgi:hypothetical protein
LTIDPPGPVTLAVADRTVLWMQKDVAVRSWREIVDPSPALIPARPATLAEE